MEGKRDVNSSSIIDLKAELFRKQEEFKKQQLQNKNASTIKGKSVEKKASVWSKKNKGVLERSSKDLEEKIEEANQYERSRKCLEAKAKLYEKITQGNDIPEEDGSQVYLVDFQKKAIDKIVEDRDKRRKEEEEERERQEEELLKHAVVPPPANEEEEWVDYVDGFGRSRRCMKKDLPELMQQDKNILKNNSVKVDNRTAEMVSNDMYKEMLRQKWEEEELAAMNQPIHYSNVQYDEIRSHGVGFYQFAKDEESRKEQLDTLNDMREKTKDERDRKEKVKEKRKAIMEARLAKVKQRKMKREGITELPGEKENDEDDIGPKLSEAAQEDKEEEREPVKKEPELLTRDENIRGTGTQREWDKGKEKLFPMSSEQRYFEDRRNERIAEFAPPSMYDDSDSSIGNRLKTDSVVSGPGNSKTKITEKQIVDFLSQEKLNSQQNWSLNSEAVSPNSTRSMKTTEDRSQPPEQVQDIPLPQSNPSLNLPNVSTNREQTHNLHQNIPFYPPPQFAPQQGTFMVPTNLPPPGYMYVQPGVPQQWPQPPQSAGYYPSVTSVHYPSTTSSVPQQNHSTDITGSQTMVKGDTSVNFDISTQQVTKPVRYNIVDPRLIQNEEVLESTPQNFTPMLEKSEEHKE
ncbi:coiled-coil domain-containing protein 174-like [Saccostrea echinata]|uniref:coiled-coil domain-containing protein 174-like n=1 Tax=Saccostrea echinata TaxID=191078 RepID=UPI002A827D68|nr:coiled-coil domain-containing protein 174-like [Saccostrea echinata]